MKPILLFLLLGLLACNTDNTTKIINDLNIQHRFDSIKYRDLSIRYNDVYKENQGLIWDSINSNFIIDSL